MPKIGERIMKRAACGLVLALLLTTMFVLSSNVQPVKAESRTWTVDDDGPADFHTIQAAIDAANEGDTIYVHDGTYNEHIHTWTASTDLRICGEDVNNTIIDGNGHGSIVNIVGGFNVTFAHFTVRNAGWTNWQEDNGIRLWGTKSSQVADCIVSGCAYGIREIFELNFQAPMGGNNTINGNSVSDCTEVAIGSSHGTSIGQIVANNTIMNNTKFGIYFNNPHNIQIVGNHVFGTESQYNHVGIHLQVGGLNNTIIGNRVEYSDYGIRLDYADSNVVEENALENCTDEAFVGVESSNNIIAGNSASGSIIGFALRDESNDNLVTNNLATNNGIGIVLSSSNGNIIHDNNITDNGNGVYLSSSSNNELSRNNITSNWVGIGLYQSSNSIIYHNNFIDNAQQVFLSQSFDTAWDDGYPSGGNYWSDYSGGDDFHGPNQDILGSDNKGDVPYYIDENNVDHYPLVNPWASPTIITATVYFKPEVLSLKGRGEWVDAFIELPENYDVSEVEISTVILNDTIHAEHVTVIGDYDNDLIPDLMVRLSRTAVSEFMLSEGVTYGNVTLTITGSLYDGTLFECDGIMKVRMPGDITCDGVCNILDVSIVGKAFGSNIGHPRWNPVADENEDGKINILDVSLVAKNFGKTYK